MVEFVTEEPDISVLADVKTLMQVLKISPMEAKFVQAMLNTKGWIGSAELPDIKYSKRQVIYTLRSKLEEGGIRILNDGTGKYTIPPGGKMVIKKLIEDQLTLGE